MNYRKIPFVRNETLHGLAPLLQPGFGPMYPNSSMLGALSRSGFVGEEDATSATNGIINDNDPLFWRRTRRGPAIGPKRGLSGGGQSESGFVMEESASGGNGITNDSDYVFARNRGLGATTVMLRPQADAPPGFPGFFGWLRDAHPDVYNYAKAALPAYVTMVEGKRTGGATLSGVGCGLGDDTTDASALTSFTATADPGSLTSVSIPDASGDSATALQAPSPSVAVASQIVSTLSQAASTLIPAINQQQIFQAQLSRAQAGLPPLNTSQYGLVGSGATGVSTTALVLGGGALLLLLLLGKK
jgi:hypothetical protein